MSENNPDPEELRRAHADGQKAGLAHGIDAELFSAADREVKEMEMRDNQVLVYQALRDAIDVDQLKALDDAVAFAEKMDQNSLPNNLKDLIHEAKAAARAKR